MNDGGSQRDLLAHPARVVADDLRARTDQVEHVQQLVASLQGLFPVEPVHRRGEVQQLGAGQPLVEIELLGEDPDAGLDRQR